MKKDNLLYGAYDLHIHTAPDIINRKLNDFEMVQRCIDNEMKGFAIKSHVIPTTGRANLMNFSQNRVNVVGTITMNNSVGGLNPFAVEVAARDKARLIWLPTIDSVNEQRHIDKMMNEDPTKLPFFARLRMDLKEKGTLQDPIYILNEAGELKPEMVDILEIASNNSMIVATGHISKDETIALVRYTNKIGFKKLIVTHPNFPSTNFTKEEQKELADLGAIMEHCFTTPYTKKMTWEALYEQIRFVGPEKCILSTDLGQPAYVYPEDGLREMIANLLKNGFTEEEIENMSVTRPTQLVEN